jgi:hypothetical protein
LYATFLFLVLSALLQMLGEATHTARAVTGRNPMKRPILLRVRLQHCVWMLGASLSFSACGPAERLHSRGDPVQEVDTGDDAVVDSTHEDDPTNDGRQTPAIEDGIFVRGDDRTDEATAQGPEDTLSPPLSTTDEAALLAQADADVTAIQQLHVVGIGGGRTQACDESACVYFCDEICLDVDPRDQATRLATLRGLAEQARQAADQLPWFDSGLDEAITAQVEEDLLALNALAVVNGVSFDDFTDECTSCYQFTIDDENSRRASALHELVELAKRELAPIETE